MTAYDPYVYRNHDEWAAQFEKALVHVQWDLERTLRGKSLPVNSIQVGLSCHIIEQYVNNWAIEIRDATPSGEKNLRIIARTQGSESEGLSAQGTCLSIAVGSYPAYCIR